MSILELECLLVVYLLIPILLTIRNVMYKRRNLTVWFGEDIVFLLSFFTAIFLIGYYAKQNFIMLLSFPFISYSMIPIIKSIIKKIKKR